MVDLGHWRALAQPTVYPPLASTDFVTALSRRTRLAKYSHSERCCRRRRRTSGSHARKTSRISCAGASRPSRRRRVSARLWLTRGHRRRDPPPLLSACLQTNTARAMRTISSGSTSGLSHLGVISGRAPRGSTPPGRHAARGPQSRRRAHSAASAPSARNLSSRPRRACNVARSEPSGRNEHSKRRRRGPAPPPRTQPLRTRRCRPLLGSAHAG